MQILGWLGELDELGGLAALAALAGLAGLAGLLVMQISSCYANFFLLCKILLCKFLVVMQILQEMLNSDALGTDRSEHLHKRLPNEACVGKSHSHSAYRMDSSRNAPTHHR